MALQRPSTKYRVFLDGDDVSKIWQPLSIKRSLGGHTPDTATLTRFPISGQNQISLQDEAVVDFPQQECEIIDDDSGVCLHWGFTAARSLNQDGRGEPDTLVSRIDEHLFGDPINGQWHWSPFEGSPLHTGEKIVFNPEVDGSLIGNLSSRRFQGAGPLKGLPLFFHPECQRSPGAIAAAGNGATPMYWSLPDAAYFLLVCGNGAEQRVQNPSFPDLLAVMDRDTRLLRNHEQPFGEYLPRNLDTLLELYGYYWYVDVSQRGKRKIVFGRRGAGRPVWASQQRIGEVLDVYTTDTEQFNLQADVASRLANEVVVFGDTPQIEVTVTLYPAWKSTSDTLLQNVLDPDSPLKRDHESWATKPDNARIGRDFVLNEAGDYKGVRNGIFSGPFEFDPFVPSDWRPCQLIPRRRKLLPMLTLGSDGNPLGQTQGVDIQWLDPLTLEWRPLTDLSAEGRTVRLLQKECGVRFDGELPPAELYERSTKSSFIPQLRVTATIELDRRLEQSSTGKGSLLRFNKAHVLDLPSRFKRRFVSLDSRFFPQGAVSSTQVDDEVAAAQLAFDLQSVWNQATIGGSLTCMGLEGIGDNVLGRPLQKIDGRNIEFRTTHQAQPAKYATITGVEHDLENSQTIYTLDTWIPKESEV